MGEIPIDAIRNLISRYREYDGVDNSPYYDGARDAFERAAQDLENLLKTRSL